MRGFRGVHKTSPCAALNVAGAQFVTAEELAKFKARAASGEFAKHRGNFKRKGSAI